MKYKHNKDFVPIAKILRKNMTQEERKLWYTFLRDYPVRIQRQKIIGDYIVDFYCSKAKLVIEIDGTQHYTDQGMQSDRIRTEEIKKFGLTIIRFANNEVNQKFKEVCEYIDYVVKQSLSQQS